MTMSDQLKHLLDQSHCLSKKQLRDYTTGTMTREETHAVEQHLNACPFCSAAVDAMLEHAPASVEALTELNAAFLKDHFGQGLPDVHLNSMAPVTPAPAAEHSPARKKIHHWSAWQISGIAAAILLVFAGIWYFEFGGDKNAAPLIAQNTASESMDSILPSAKTAPEAATVARTEKTTPPAADPKRPQEAGHAAAAPETSAAPVSEYKTAAADREQQETADKKSADFIPPDPLASGNSYNSRLQLQDAPALNKEKEAVAARKAMDSDTRRMKAYSLSESAAPAAAPAQTSSTDEGLGRGRELFNSKNYSAALPVFQKGMNSGDKATRDEATYYAARCYLAMGQKTAARRLLQQLAGSNAAQKKAAEKLLEDLDRTEE